MAGIHNLSMSVSFNSERMYLDYMWPLIRGATVVTVLVYYDGADAHYNEQYTSLTGVWSAVGQTFGNNGQHKELSEETASYKRHE